MIIIIFIVRLMSLRMTPQRHAVLTLINRSARHWDAEAISQALQENNQRIGIATIYRTLSVLEEAGLIAAVVIGQRKHYERIDKPHHDHMVCESCGRIEEFFHQDIETLQHDIAKHHGFCMQGHSLVIFGLCRRCQ